MKQVLFILLISLLVTSSACGPGQVFGPTLTATPTITQTPTSTSTPTSTATSTSTPSRTPTPVPDGPCDNPLVPLEAGNQWNYLVTSPNGASLFSLNSLEIRKGANIVALVEYSDQQHNLSIQDSVICQDGAIVNYPLFVLNMLFSDYLDKYIETIHESVDYAPRHQNLLQNNWTMTWRADYLTEDEAYLRNPSGQANLFIAFSTHIEVSFILDNSWEPVTVPAGYFPQALKITQDYYLPVTLVNPGSNSGTADTLKFSTTQWYAEDIGLLRAEISSAFLHGTIPLPVESSLELVEFQPVK